MPHGFRGAGSSLAQRSAHDLANSGEGAASQRLVVRKASPSDRRARVVELTAEGRRLATSCFERHAKDLEALMSALSEKEMEQLHGSLKKLGLLAAEKLEEQNTVQEQ